jgi:CRISPR-associated protein Cas2
MPMTVVVTRNVAPRFRGLLASSLLEIAPGVYSNPRLTKGVRERIWKVCEEWFCNVHAESEASIVMTWQDRNAPGGQAVKTLGCPTREFIDHEGFLLSRMST